MPPGLPTLAAACLRRWIPGAEQAEVLGDLAEEYARRRALRGRLRAEGWLWRQVAGSLPALVRRSWWRGWTGFEPEANRMQPGGAPMESWIMDVRYAARRLRTRPTYALLAILTLALGVGGTAAIFSLVRGLLFERLPYAHEEQLAVFWNQFDWSEAEYLFLKPQVTGFQSFATWRSADVTLEEPGAPARLLHGIASSANLFDVLGSRPAIGRTFQTDEDRQGAENVVVLSDAMWHQLGADPGILGRRLRMAGVDCTVIGVMPPRFWFPDPEVQVWFAASLNPQSRSGQYAQIGRLPPGRSIESMGPTLAQITGLLATTFQYSAQWDKTKNAKLTPVREYLLGSLRPALLATAVAMALILLIACANVAALMLGQVDGRAGELAVRSALGANRRRLAQQLVAEAVLVGCLAGAVGAGLAALGFRFLVAMLPLGAWGQAAHIDWTLFALAIVIALVAAVGIALVPVVSLWRGDVRGRLARVRGGGSGRMEGGLVVAEVALAVLMAAGAALLIRSVTKLYAIDPGLDTRQVAVVDITMPIQMPTELRQRTLRELVAAVSAIPGVRSASAAQRLPLRGTGDNWGIRIAGHPELPPSTTAFRIVEPGYFETMGYRLVAGRVFNGTDRPEGEREVVINEALARQYFGGENPVGRQVVTFDSLERVIGVVGNASEANLVDSAAPARYMLYDQIPYAPSAHSIVMRTSRPGDVPAVLSAARRVIQQAAPSVAVQELTSMQRVFALAVGPARQVMGLLAVLTALAMLLGAIGVYGVISHFVNRRMRDWGIRMALGLAPPRVVAHVVRRGLALVAVGAVIGVAAALAGSRLLTSFLYGVSAGDPLSLAAATTALLAAGALAAYAPARRASRVDPASVLREQ